MFPNRPQRPGSSILPEGGLSLGEQQDRLSSDHDATKIEQRVEVALQPIADVLFHRDNATKLGFLQLIALPFSWLPRLSEFFRHLPRFTTTLHLIGSFVQNLDEERLPHLFIVVPQIQHLYLEELNERSRLIPIMQALWLPVWTDSIEGAGLSTLPFPNLHTISFILDNENSHARPDEHLAFIEALIGIIWMRFEDSHDAVLRIELNVELDWPDDEDWMTKVAIDWVANYGLVLDIREKGQIVEWVNLVKAKAEVQIS
ncbi:hypothetical protein AN958_09710 [Leucoagaricus sp. SymC.cos]|nr:hypothetical protein AN958_09710 [Leucoagaricus sp. SymC.cos]